MKTFVCLLAVTLTLATVYGHGYGGSSGGGGGSGGSGGSYGTSSAGGGGSYGGSSGGGGGSYGGSSGGGGGSYGGSSGGGAPSGGDSHGYGGSSAGSAGGAAVGGGPVSIPAPPCPKNYLFSCQPSLAPVACVKPAAGGHGPAGYGSAGAYSENVPTILSAPYGYPQAPHNLFAVPSYYGNY